jgi:hypothetical protein
MDIVNIAPLFRPQVETMQKVLHDAIKENLRYMSALNPLWTDLDRLLVGLDALEFAIELDQERRAFEARQKPQAAATDAYLQELSEEAEQ